MSFGGDEEWMPVFYPARRAFGMLAGEGIGGVGGSWGFSVGSKEIELVGESIV